MVADHVLQRDAVEKLHHDEGLAFTLADFVDGTDVGMIQGRRGTSFPAKAFQRLRISRQFIGQELEGDKAAKLGILGLVHHAHPAAAQLLNDAIVRDGFADHLRECYGVRSGMSMYGLTATSRTPPWL